MQPLIELDLTGSAFGGEAIGRTADGRPVFVPFGIPGEKVRVELIEEKTSYSRGRITEILSPSPQRIQPRCQHFGICGGCHLQHLTYAGQLEIKQKILADQFRRIGKFSDPPVETIIPSPREWNYRNTVQFHLTANGKVGYQMMGTNQVVEIHECALPLEGIGEVWQDLEIDPSAGVKRLSLREGSDGDLLLALEGQEDVPPEFAVDFPLSAVYKSAIGEFALSGDPYTLMQVKDREFRVSASSFFQVNLPQAEKMVDLVLDSLALQPEDTILDAYCGVGLFSAFIAPKVKKVIGVEQSESACEDYTQNLDAQENVELYVGSAEEILPHLAASPTGIITDPPRVGLAKAALEAMVKMQPKRIVYVSCDPSTLARDARRLVEHGYELIRITPLDLFPQTYHIEAVCLFTKIAR